MRQNKITANEPRRLTPTHAVLAGAVIGMLVMPLAFAGANDPVATSSASAKKQIKSLQKRVAALEGKQTPTTLPPSGPAGGDLTGTYPAPTIGPNKVDTTKLADNAVTSPKILDGQVSAADLGALTRVEATVPGVSDNTSQLVLTPACPGAGVAISAGGVWSGTSNEAKYIQAIVPNSSDPGIWGVTGRNQSGGLRDFTAYALCLS